MIRGKTKIVSLLVLTVVVGVSLYCLNRYWITPATVLTVARPAYHPMAPDFEVTDLSGAIIRLSDFHGKVVLLDFWATWCPHCRREIPGFIQLQDRYGDRGFKALGVVTQDVPQNVPGFYRQFHMNYPVAMATKKMVRLYGVTLGLPTTFLIGRDGRIDDKVVGGEDMTYFEGKIQSLLSEDPKIASR
jgi:thiol-disulfide isomerase/thioredoxin